MKLYSYLFIFFLISQINFSQQQSNIILSNFFNGTHQIIVYQNLSVKFVQLINPSNNFIQRPQSYVFTNETHMLKIDENSRTSITSLIQNSLSSTNNPSQSSQQLQTTTNKYVIFSVTNGTHLITVYQDLTLKVEKLTNQNQNVPPTDPNSQMIFCSGLYELGVYGDGRVVKAPLFSLWQPPFFRPFYFQKYVISGFFNGTHRLTVYNDGRMDATPVYYYFPSVIPFYYTSNILRNQINNVTHDMKIYNNGRVEFFRLI